MTVFQRKAAKRGLGDVSLSSDIGARAMKGSFATVGAQGIRLILQMMGAIVLARLLSPDDFGLVAMGTAVVGFGMLLAEFGLASATVQRKELDEDVVSTLFYIQVGIALILMLLLMLLSPLIGAAFSDKRVQPLILVLAPTLPLFAASSQHIALLQRQMRWYKMQGVGILAQAFGTVAAIGVCLTTDLGYWALVIQSWIVGLTTCLLAWAWSPWVPGRVSDWSKAQPAIGFGFGLMGYNLLNSWHRQFDNIIIGAVAGAEQLGYYSRAYGLLMIPRNAVIRPFDTAVYPAMSRLQSDPPRWRQMYLSSVSTISCLTVLIAGLLLLLADTLVPLIYGDQWNKSIPIFKILAISMLIQPAYNAAGLISFSLGNSKRMLKASFLSTGVYTIAFVIGAMQGGAIGVAVAYTFAVYLIAPFWLWWATRGTSLNQYQIYGTVAPSCVAGLAAFGLTQVILPHADDLWRAAATGTLFFLLYTAFLCLLWLTLRNWRKDMRPVINRGLSLAGDLKVRLFRC